jgi:NADPH:quinone reductase-like Zn-dependent oxidoreductase
VRAAGAGGSFELIGEPVRDAAAGYARVRVQACRICDSDFATKEGLFPGIAYPRSPDHEIAGVIDALGADPEPWKVGDHVGMAGAAGTVTLRIVPTRRPLEAGLCHRCGKNLFMQSSMTDGPGYLCMDCWRKAGS